MDDRTRANWFKVREALEAAAKTDCYLYHRAVAITAGQPDPGPFGPMPTST